MMKKKIVLSSVVGLILGVIIMLFLSSKTQDKIIEGSLIVPVIDLSHPNGNNSFHERVFKVETAQDRLFKGRLSKRDLDIFLKHEKAKDFQAHPFRIKIKATVKGNTILYIHEIIETTPGFIRRPK